MRVRYTRRALANLDKIFTYIAQDDPQAAASVVDRIERLVAMLADTPEMGPPTNRPGIRRLPVVDYPYLIFYEILGDEVIIHHIRHGARLSWAGRR